MTEECHIVIGNHQSYSGIGEILYTLETYFSGRYLTRVSESIVPDRLNVIIDDFSSRERISYIRQTKQDRPATRFILMATEFITPIALLGMAFGNTFNFFDAWDDRRHLAGILANRLRLKAAPPYLYQRYHGFLEALACFDLILCAHPAVAATMRRLPERSIRSASPPLTLYPVVDLERLANDRRLRELPAGFVMTGTLTPYRKRLAREMVETFHKAGVRQPVYQHLQFDHSNGVQFDGQRLDLGYDAAPVTGRTLWYRPRSVANYLYNLNPPQRTKWPFSSPMRILRAILLGQIPVVTRVFADHDIEAVASRWDGTVETAARMWAEATVGRKQLVERHLAAVADYDRAARERNAAIDRALASLG